MQRTDWTSLQLAAAPAADAPQVQGSWTAMRKGEWGRAFGEMGGDLVSATAKSFGFLAPVAQGILGPLLGGGKAVERNTGLPAWIVPAGVAVAVAGGLILLLRPSGNQPQQPIIVLSKGAA